MTKALNMNNVTHYNTTMLELSRPGDTLTELLVLSLHLFRNVAHSGAKMVLWGLCKKQICHFPLKKTPWPLPSWHPAARPDCHGKIHHLVPPITLKSIQVATSLVVSCTGPFPGASLQTKQQQKHLKAHFIAMEDACWKKNNWNILKQRRKNPWMNNLRKMWQKFDLVP